MGNLNFESGFVSDQGWMIEQVVGVGTMNVSNFHFILEAKSGRYFGTGTFSGNIQVSGSLVNKQPGPGQPTGSKLPPDKHYSFSGPCGNTNIKGTLVPQTNENPGIHLLFNFPEPPFFQGVSPSTDSEWSRYYADYLLNQTFILLNENFQAAAVNKHPFSSAGDKLNLNGKIPDASKPLTYNVTLELVRTQQK